MDVTLTLDLPNDLERALAAEADEFGIPLEEYALRVLAEGRVAAAEAPIAKTGAELVDFWRREGLIGYRSDITDSLEYARELRRQAERRPAHRDGVGASR
jgi:hypothetical protein